MINLIIAGIITGVIWIVTILPFAPKLKNPKYKVK